MRKVVRKSPIKKEVREPVEKLERLELSANQRRFLQVLETGTDVNEPSLLAGRP
ncbi:hypothetical protein [Pseudomonas moraviensis]|uniref:hypothetical protein n=1 Tax=Pseudomonas moraviensis TaxID=321662 RepID=UPI0022BC7836|nr:hypothetical protein [Pseudomonas moraviensis]GLH37321.1 hypothetical protein RS1P1_16040 [Pseudomonas moraviensis]